MTKMIKILNIPDYLYEDLVEIKKKYKASTWIELLWIIREIMGE